MSMDIIRSIEQEQLKSHIPCTSDLVTLYVLTLR